MRILLLELELDTGETLAKAARSLAGEGDVWPFQSTEAAARQLDEGEVNFDLTLISGDDGDQLLAAFAALSATGNTPPALIVSACTSVEAVVNLHKAGINGFLVRDSADAWIDRLPEEVAAIAKQSHSLRLRTRLDNELGESQRRLSQIVDGSSVAMFVIDHLHVVTHWNRACEALTGIATSDVVGTNQQWRAFYPEARPCLADLVLDGAIEDRVAQYYGTKGFRRSAVLAGTYEAEDFFPGFGDGGRWLFFTAAPLKDDHGRVIGAIETLQDISEQKRAKDALHQSETLLRQIIESSSVATFVINNRHEVTHWNRACEKLFGRSANTAIGTRSLAREIYHHDRPVLADLALSGSSKALLDLYYAGRYRKSAIADEIYEVEDLFPDLPGGERWLHFAAAPLRNDEGETIGAIETLIDITERKYAEERLLESEQRLAQIIDGSAVATFVIDHEHRVTHWNQACSALTGLAASELIGTRQQWRAFYPDERPCMADLVLDGAMEERVAQYYGSKKYHRSQVVEGGFEAEDFFANFGSNGRWLYFTAAPLYSAQGKIIGAIETLQDITEQKSAEENLRQSEERYRLLSITDGMTELYNARHFAQKIQEEMERAERYQHPLALIVLDVDNFKKFNDTWGHVQGDQVLISLAKCINLCLRRTDQAFRYGGEEFVALLPETGMEMAEAAAERIRSTFAATEIRPVPGQTVQCTASIGVTTFIPGETPRDFLARADSASYEAKRQGKNRVIPISPDTAGYSI